MLKRDQILHRLNLLEACYAAQSWVEQFPEDATLEDLRTFRPDIQDRVCAEDHRGWITWLLGRLLHRDFLSRGRIWEVAREVYANVPATWPPLIEAVRILRESDLDPRACEVALCGVLKGYREDPDYLKLCGTERAWVVNLAYLLPMDGRVPKAGDFQDVLMDGFRDPDWAHHLRRLFPTQEVDEALAAVRAAEEEP